MAAENQTEAFLVEVHPEVAGLFVADGGRRAQRLGEETQRLFVFEGVDYLGREELSIAAEGSREVITRAALPVTQGQQLDVTISERNTYESRDGVARLGGYAIVVFGAGELVGRKVSVVIDRVSRNCAYARRA